MKKCLNGAARKWPGSHSAVRATALAAVLVLAVPVAATAGAATAVPVAAAAAPHPARAVWESDGELALIADGRLELLGNDGSEHVVALTGPGAPSRPSWSPDGKWVAFLRPPVQPGYDAAVSTLWTARSDGSDARRLSAPGADVTQFAWRPTVTGGGEELAFSTVSLPSYTSSDIYLATGSAPPQRFAKYTGLIDFSWAPSGASLAISYRKGPAGQPGAGKGFVQISPLDGQAGRTVYTLADNGYVELVGWWPDGKGLLLWDDPYGSASIAADGLALDSLELSSLKLRSLATTLTYPDWVSWSPDGRTVAVVAGGDREIWYSGKHVELCAIPAAACHAVPLPSGHVMSLDPAWSAPGTLVYVVAPAAGPTTATATTTTSAAGAGGWGPSGPWTTQNVAAWYGAQHLFTAGAAGGGGRVLAAAGTGAHNPAPTSAGLLYVQGANLRYLPRGASRPVTIATGLDSPGIYANNYYGYIAWSQDFAWHP
jgi:TolB protein